MSYAFLVEILALRRVVSLFSFWLVLLLSRWLPLFMLTLFRGEDALRVLISRARSVWASPPRLCNKHMWDDSSHHHSNCSIVFCKGSHFTLHWIREIQSKLVLKLFDQCDTLITGG